MSFARPDLLCIKRPTVIGVQNALRFFSPSTLFIACVHAMATFKQKIPVYRLSNVIHSPP